VKPGNILLDRKQHAKLTDFDLVWAADTTGGTRSRAGMGSYLYASPEQEMDASRVSCSADIYGLAVLTIFLLRRDLHRWFRDSRSTMINGLPIPPAFRSLLDRATQASPEYRPSLEEFLRTAELHWPREPEIPVTTKPMALYQKELEVSTLKVERTEADGSPSAKPVTQPTELPMTILAARRSSASLPVAPLASTSTLDPVTTDHDGARKGRSLRITVVASGRAAHCQPLPRCLATGKGGPTNRRRAAAYRRRSQAAAAAVRSGRYDDDASPSQHHSRHGCCCR
jgi:serine/threonine protein kinase